MDAIRQECLGRLTSLRTLTAEHAPHIVRADAQLAGHAVAIYRDDCGRLR